MVNTYSGGCDHIRSHSDKQPFDIHICHCSVCKCAIGQDITHLALFKHDDLIMENVRDLKIEPFNDQNLDGPLLMYSCIDCGRLIMIDDKEKRVHAIVPNLMGYDATNFPATTMHSMTLWILHQNLLMGYRTTRAFRLILPCLIQHKGFLGHYELM